MNVLIVEDEANAVKQIRRLLKECDNTINVLGHVESVSEGVNWFKTNPPPDLIFMDIQLSDGLSFELFDQIKVDQPVIFCTAYDQYAIQAFKVNSIDYLLKPLEIGALHQSLEKHRRLQYSTQYNLKQIASLVRDITQSQHLWKTRFLVKHLSDLLSIHVDQIAYFYIEHKIVNLVTNTGNCYVIDYTLDDLETQLNNRVFFRINRQAIVSINAIKKLENDYGRLNLYTKTLPKKYFTISREKTTPFKRWVEQ